MSTSFESESQKSPETLEQEIDAKRANINDIVDSLESRFTPGQLFDQALSYTKGNGGEFFQNLGTTLKNNPLPTALTGIGLAWLAMNQNKPFNPGPSGPGLGEKIGGAVGQVKGVLAQAGERLHGAADSAKAKGQNLKYKAGDLTQRTADSLDSSKSELGGYAHGATEKLGAQASQLKGQFDQTLKEQPLVLAAIGIALGAVLGAALPSTRKEDELFGKASDQALAKAKSKGEEAYAVAKDTLKQAAEGPRPTAGQATSEAPSPAGTSSDLSSGLGIQP